MMDRSGLLRRAVPTISDLGPLHRAVPTWEGSDYFGLVRLGSFGDQIGPGALDVLQTQGNQPMPEGVPVKAIQCRLVFRVHGLVVRIRDKKIAPLCYRCKKGGVFVPGFVHMQERGLW